MSRISIFLWVALMLVAIGSAGTAQAEHASALYWSDVAPASIPSTGDRVVTPVAYRAMQLDLDGIAGYLASAPLEGTVGFEDRAILSLPLPDGTSGRFAVVESPIMAPELAARYPEIRTYAGVGIDDPTATTRLDVTPLGFHALILSEGGTVYIDPFQRGDIHHYQSYFKRDYASFKTLGGCTVVDDDDMASEIAGLIARNPDLRSGTQLRTYRTVVAATGEYTDYFGGTVAQGMAAIVVSMNRVSGVYEREVSIRFVLVANNDLVVYTDGATDPYTNNNGSTMLGQNQTNLDSVIGSANYDIGHVFSTGGGGIAGLGVVCRTSQKAKGVTGSPAPVNDAFDIDYVAHEIGHQFGSNHSFNGNSGSCSGGNRNASTAYEPGSGSTIMAYAGICSGQNLQLHSDDYFHWKSIDEIIAYSTTGSGNSCPVTTATGVVEPVVNAGITGLSIPISTPLQLTASATTVGAPTYCWEESDLGPAGSPNSPSGNAPIFRSFDPVATPTRIFPKVSNLVNNTQTIGEILPTYARALTFKVVVRDTQAGGVGISKAGNSFTVVATAGPFLVTYPNAVGLTISSGTPLEVTWNVASTDLAPVNCANVNILLSTDGGYTWPTVLLTGTPNDGSEAVTLPSIDVTTARIKVEAADNIFFDISNYNFTITSVDPADAPTPTATAAGLSLLPNLPNPFRGSTAVRFSMPKAGAATVRVYDPAGRLVRTILAGPVQAGDQTALWDGTDSQGQPVNSGVYLYRLEALNRTLSGRMLLVR